MNFGDFFDHQVSLLGVIIRGIEGFIPQHHKRNHYFTKFFEKKTENQPPPWKLFSYPTAP